MIGPTKKQMSYMVCTGCEVVISRELNGTKIYPKKRTVNYCSHPDLSSQVAFIKGYPKTPKWCPVN